MVLFSLVWNFRWFVQVYGRKVERKQCRRCCNTKSSIYIWIFLFLFLRVISNHISWVYFSSQLNINHKAPSVVFLDPFLPEIFHFHIYVMEFDWSSKICQKKKTEHHHHHYHHDNHHCCRSNIISCINSYEWWW